MRAIKMLLPAVPTFLKELVSQFKPRIRYLISSPVLVLDEHRLREQGNPSCDLRWHSVEITIRGSYQDRVIIRERIGMFQLLDMSPKQWDCKDILLVRLKEGLFFLHNHPKLKIRPFPGETFRLVVDFGNGCCCQTPYHPTEIRKVQ